MTHKDADEWVSGVGVVGGGEWWVVGGDTGGSVMGVGGWVGLVWSGHHTPELHHVPTVANATAATTPGPALIPYCAHSLLSTEDERTPRWWATME